MGARPGDHTEGEDEHGGDGAAQAGQEVCTHDDSQDGRGKWELGWSDVGHYCFGSMAGSIVAGGEAELVSQQELTHHQR